MTQPLSRHSRLCGVFTALVTPMREGVLDLPAFESHVARQLDAGIRGLVPVGTTGEASTLTGDETAQIIRSTVALARGRAFVLAGAGANATRTAIDNARRAADLGADGLLIATPSYNLPSQAGLFAHFAAVAAAVEIPIMLYSVPGRTGVELAPATVARLGAACANIVGIKEAGGRAERVTALRMACGPDFVIHSGDDTLTLPFLALGADGVTSVASNVAPMQVAALHAAWVAGDTRTALRLHEGMFDLVRHLFIETNPVPVKAVLAAMGCMSSEVRAPLCPLGSGAHAALQASLQRWCTASLATREGFPDVSRKPTSQAA